MRHATIKRALSSLACVGLLVGCGEQLDPASLLNQTRPVGVLF